MLLRPEEIAAHEKRMRKVEKQMPDDIREALVKLNNWIGLPDTWDEQIERKACAAWKLQELAFLSAR